MNDSTGSNNHLRSIDRFKSMIILSVRQSVKNSQNVVRMKSEGSQNVVKMYSECCQNVVSA